MKKLMLGTALAAVTTFAMTAPVSAAQTEAQAEVRGSAMSDMSASVPAFLASNFTGKAVHNVDAANAEALRNRNAAGAADGDAGWTVSEEAEQIGRINDVVMSEDGEIRGVLVDVGGFLGLGAHTVLLDFDDLQFAPEADEAGDLDDFLIIVSLSQDELEAMPEWNDDQLGSGRDVRRTDPRDGQSARDHSGTASEGLEDSQTGAAQTPAQTRQTFAPTGTGSGMTEGNAARPADRSEAAGEDARREREDDVSAAPSDPSDEEYESISARNARLNAAAERAEARDAEDNDGVISPNSLVDDNEGERSNDHADAVFSDSYRALGAEERTADRLDGADVYDSAGERIGSVNDLILRDGGEIESALVDVGGFLGIGARTVNLPINQADIRWSQDDDDVRVQVPLTRTQIEALPEHED